MPKAQTQAPIARHPAALLMQIRALHTYVGMLIAPTVLFMAFTGIVQIYGLHEAHEGYTPPAILEKLGSVHKDQRFAPGHHHAPPPGAAAQPGGGAAKPPKDDDDQPNMAIALLKAFFAAVSVGLIFSTFTGIWMALRQGGKRRGYIVLLVIGAAVPALLAAFSA